MALNINYPTIPRNLIGTAVDCLTRGEKIALLSLINIEGRAPYPIGSQMLVRQDGQYHGQITGGCAETALAEQAVTAISQGKNTTPRYGRGSPFFDIKLPCGSGVDVHVDVTTSLSDYQRIDSLLKARGTAKQTFDTPLGVFNKVYQPNERLLLFGQGPILMTLAELAIVSGFEVICFVQGGTSLNQLSEMGIKTNGLALWESEFSDYCDQFTAVVSLFHEHDIELDILTTAVSNSLFYVGALGSQQTHANRIEELQNKISDTALLSKIFGPVGLDIRAQSPAQIAISILAQIVEQMPIVQNEK